jgi:hypothetical protein
MMTATVYDMRRYDVYPDSAFRAVTYVAGYPVNAWGRTRTAALLALVNALAAAASIPAEMRIVVRS